jgi:endonuclease YncB( thermonuclease family)
MLRFLVFLTVISITTPLFADVTGTPSVIDGDTLDIRSARIRLHGIDAPESRQLCQKNGNSYPCGRQAALALNGLINRRSLRCEERDRDRYGRIVAICFLGDLDLNDWLVRQGHAVAYRRYSEDYVGAENAARAARRGIWDGEFELPWEWRKATRSKSAGPVAVAPKGCPIKGNVSKSGRIYHMPGGQGYEKTKVDTSKGERWFYSEDEARSAGWR